jgi:formate hydrogenlyase subunit 3/multisubunit Na+/H+ antiporter MnhD subunit
VTAVLPWLALGFPVALLLACLARPVRAHMLALLPIAPLPGLATALAAPVGLVEEGPWLLLGMALALDPTGAVFLGATALLWIAAGAYAAAYLRGKALAERFAAFWLLTLTGGLGVFLAADIVSFYLSFALVSLTAYGLVVHEETARAHRAAFIYILLALSGEICLLLGFMLLAAAADSLLIAPAVAALPASPWRDLTLLLLVAGFGLKAGLVPLHVWLPLAHPAAPTPASAVLSGALVKAGIFGLLRFLPLEAGMPAWGEAIALAGLFTAFYGVAVGLTQSNPKTVLAYSTVSQMGLATALLGVALAEADAGVGQAAALHAAHHALAKGALFLAVGVAAATGRDRLAWVLAATAVLAVALGGLPLTGGALAKLAMKEPLGEGYVGRLAGLTSVTTTVLMVHFLRCLAATAAEAPAAAAPPGLVVPWLVAALAALLVPWGIHLAGEEGALAYALAPAILWEQLWPVLLGALGALALARWVRLPALPEGDLVVLGEGAARRVAPLLRPPRIAPPPLRPRRGLTLALTRAERVLREWPAAGLSLLAVMLLLGASVALLP